MKPLTLQSIFAPQHYVSKMLGVLPLTTKNDQLVFSKICVSQTLVYLSLYFYVAQSYYRVIFVNYPSDLSHLKTLKVIGLVRYVGYTTVMILTFFSVCFTYKKFVLLIKKVVGMDDELGKLGLEKRVYEIGYRIRKKLYFLIFMVYFLGSIISIALSRTGNIKGLVTLLYPRLVACNMSVTYYVATFLLEERFKIINNYLFEENLKSLRLLKYPTDIDFGKKVKLLMNLHRNLTRICISINSIFSLYFLFWVAINFICLVGDLYVTAYLFSSGLYIKYWKGLLRAMKNVVVYSSEMFYLSRRSSLLCIQV